MGHIRTFRCIVRVTLHSEDVVKTKDGFVLFEIEQSERREGGEAIE